jgi:hypothetical protein
MFTESKAHTKAIDLELRRIDVQQSNQHVQYLAAYMPDTFMSRGGKCLLSVMSYNVGWCEVSVQAEYVCVCARSCVCVYVCVCVYTLFVDVLYIITIYSMLQ